MAITNAVESIYGCIEKSFAERSQNLPAIMKYINKVPISYLMFLFCGGLGIQLRILYPSLVNKYMYRLLSTLSNGKGDKIVKSFVDIIMGLD